MNDYTMAMYQLIYINIVVGTTFLNNHAHLL